MKPLQNRRIVITRPPHKAASFADQLRALGAEPIILPTISIEPLDDFSELDQALHQAYDWVIFTSANSVERVWQRVTDAGISLLVSKIAAVGKATADALREHGVQPDLIPAAHTAAALYDALTDLVDLRGQRIFLPQGDLARPFLANHLQAAEAKVTCVTAYRNVRPPIDTALLARPFDAITFTSPSTIHNFMALFDDPLNIIGSAHVACIGSVTAAAARDEGLPVHTIAEPHTIDGLTDALCKLFQRTTTP